MKTPKNKQEVLNVSKRSNEHWEYDRNLLNMLYKFLVDIGANKDLPDDKTQLKGYLVRLHETITIKNSMFPLYTDFLELYQAWMNDVIFGKIGRNGNNISALARCFNEWYKANANNWIKKEHKEEQVERTSGRGNETIETMSDDELLKILKIIDRIGGNDMGSLFNTTEAMSYCNRVLEECKKRGLVET